MDELRARQAIYNLLATFFQGAPDPATVALLQTEPVLVALEGLLAGETGGNRVLQRLRTATPEELAEWLAVDYTMLFSAPGATQVPPYESVYRDSLEIVTPPQPEIDYTGGTRVFEGLFWGDSTVAVASEYRAEGFDPGDAIPDSLGLELAFMAYLVERQAKFAEAGNAAAADAYAYRQGRFLREHLLAWAPTFAARVYKNRSESFYALATVLVVSFLEAEAAACV